MDASHIPGLTPEETAAFAAITKSYGLLRRAAARIVAEHHSMHIARFQALAFAASRAEGVRMFELADQLMLSRSTLTHHIAELEKEGLVTREDGTPSQRAVRARATKLGKKRIRELKNAYAEVFRTHFFAQFTPEELRIVTEGFTRVAESLEAAEAGGAEGQSGSHAGEPHGGKPRGSESRGNESPKSESPKNGSRGCEPRGCEPEPKRQTQQGTDPHPQRVR